MELKQIPFGNNFYTTTECGGTPYDPSKRHCWAGKCIGNSPAADCFTGEIVAQHGDAEKNMNRMQACGKWQNTTWQEYWPFLHCIESEYESQGVAAAKTCVEGSKIDYDALEKCYNGKDGDLAQIREAKQTVDHVGTPDVAVAGKGVTFPVTAGAIIEAVCNAYTGSKPAACKSKKAAAAATVAGAVCHQGVPQPEGCTCGPPGTTDPKWQCEKGTTCVMYGRRGICKAASDAIPMQCHQGVPQPVDCTCSPGTTDPNWQCEKGTTCVMFGRRAVCKPAGDAILMQIAV